MYKFLCEYKRKLSNLKINDRRRHYHHHRGRRCCWHLTFVLVIVKALALVCLHSINTVFRKRPRNKPDIEKSTSSEAFKATSHLLEGGRGHCSIPDVRPPQAKGSAVRLVERLNTRLKTQTWGDYNL